MQKTAGLKFQGPNFKGGSATALFSRLHEAQGRIAQTLDTHERQVGMSGRGSCGKGARQKDGIAWYTPFAG